MKDPAFPPLLRRLMAAQGLRVVDIARELGVETQTVVEWRQGERLPLVHNAVKLADVLSAPSLLHMTTRARTMACGFCHRDFIVTNSGGRPRKYCSEQCQSSGTAERRRSETRERWGKVHTRWENRYRKAQDAIDRMCHECADWEGVCRMAECPLRAVSPLPLAKEEAA